jgi:nucleotide-binding universal stress UspA family protein
MKATSAQTRVDIKTILYATDFSECSELAVPYVCDIARLYDSTVIAVHVMPAISPTSTTLDPRLLAKHKEMMDLSSRLGEVPHRCLVLDGAVWEALEEVVKEEAVDLVVLGTHGRTGADRIALGSVAEEIFRRTDCPVLTVGPHVARRALSRRQPSLGAHAPAESNIHTILYPVDFSEESLAAAPFALSMAQEHQAKLVLLHVLEGSGKDQLKDPPRLNQLVRELKEIVPQEAALWCEPEYLVEFGMPAKRILEISEELEADLIIMGVRGLKRHRSAHRVRAAFTAHKVVSHAECPVLTVLG